MVFSCFDWGDGHPVKKVVGMMHDDLSFMRHALAIAEKYGGLRAPNPCVGCVIVADGQVIASGVTGVGGRPHAETCALQQAGEKAKGATLYVTLEPCAHEGKTPPCAQAIVNAGIARVIVATRDPDVRVCGKGITALQEAGIEVCVGVMAREAQYLHRDFFTRIIKKRPWVVLKVATTLDGKIALKNGVSKWITDDRARQHARYQRLQCDAILTGIGTVVVDNPLLTVRDPYISDEGRLRIVLDSACRLNINSLLYQESSLKRPLLIYHREDVSCSIPHREGVTCVASSINKNGRIDINFVLENLAQRGINSLFVEGGQGILTSFLKAGVVDQLLWYRSSSIMGDSAGQAAFDFNISSLSDMIMFPYRRTYQISSRVNLDVLHADFDFSYSFG